MCIFQKVWKSNKPPYLVSGISDVLYQSRILQLRWEWVLQPDHGVVPWVSPVWAWGGAVPGKAPLLADRLQSPSPAQAWWALPPSQGVVTLPCVALHVVPKLNQCTVHLVHPMCLTCPKTAGLVIAGTTTVLTCVLCPLPWPVLWLWHQRWGLRLHPLPSREVFQRRLSNMQAPQRLRRLLPGHCADARRHGEWCWVWALSPWVSMWCSKPHPWTHSVETPYYLIGDDPWEHEHLRPVV